MKLPREIKVVELAVDCLDDFHNAVFGEDRLFYSIRASVLLRQSRLKRERAFGIRDCLSCKHDEIIARKREYAVNQKIVRLFFSLFLRKD
jgi:hypothetical protein